MSKLPLKLLIGLILLTLTTSCKQNLPAHCKVDEKVLAFNDSIHQSVAKGRKKSLERMKEDELSDWKYKSYRLFVFRSFSERAFTVYQITDFRDRVEFRTKIAYGRGKKYSFRVFTSQISRTAWEKLDDSFNKNCFLTSYSDIQRQGLDGYSVVVEAVDPDQSDSSMYYHFASRWSPEENDPIRIIASEIMELAAGKDRKTALTE